MSVCTTASHNPFDDPTPPSTTKKAVTSTPSLATPQSPRREAGVRSPSPNPPSNATNTNMSSSTNASSSTTSSSHMQNATRRADSSRSVSPSSAMSGSFSADVRSTNSSQKSGGSSYSSNRSPSPNNNATNSSFSMSSYSNSGHSSVSNSLPPSRSQSQPRSLSPSSEVSTPSTLARGYASSTQFVDRSASTGQLNVSISNAVGNSSSTSASSTTGPKVYGASFAIPNVSLVTSGTPSHSMSPSSKRKYEKRGLCFIILLFFCLFISIIFVF
jgi:hypothetical protein